MPPIRYIKGISVIYLVLVNHCKEMAPDGGAYTTSTNPVCRPTRTSGNDKGIAEMPASSKIALAIGASSQVQTFACLKSSSEAIGFVDSNRINPPSDQAGRM